MLPTRTAADSEPREFTYCGELASAGPAAGGAAGGVDAGGFPPCAASGAAASPIARMPDRRTTGERVMWGISGLSARGGRRLDIDLDLLERIAIGGKRLLPRGNAVDLEQVGHDGGVIVGGKSARIVLRHRRADLLEQLEHGATAPLQRERTAGVLRGRVARRAHVGVDVLPLHRLRGVVWTGRRRRSVLGSSLGVRGDRDRPSEQSREYEGGAAALHRVS